MRGRLAVALIAAALAPALAGAAPAAASGPVPTAFPPDFPAPADHSLRRPVLGFGAKGPVRRTPVIFVHGNNDTPYKTTCNSLGHIHDFARYFHDRGYALSELWGLGYEGDQCDLLTSPTNRSGEAHTTVANVPDLRAFVAAVLKYTGAPQVDIVGHSLGTTIAREWMRQDGAHGLVRTLVGVDGPNHGIINCSPSPLNYYALPAAGGFHPNSPVCLEYGSIRTPLLTELNAGDETPGATAYLMLVNADTSFVFFSKQDGAFAPVPAQDREGRPHDFSASARLEGATNVGLTGQGRYDEAAGAAHLGIVNSPEAWRIAYAALEDQGRPAPAPAPGSPPAGRGTEPAATVPAARVRVPPGMRARVTPARDPRPPFGFITRGRVEPPSGVAARDACGRGTVAIQVKARRTTISTRRARLRADCSFSSRVAFRRLPPRRLSFTVRFAGNSVLTPASTRLRARAG